MRGQVLGLGGQVLGLGLGGQVLGLGLGGQGLGLGLGLGICGLDSKSGHNRRCRPAIAKDGPLWYRPTVRVRVSIWRTFAMAAPNLIDRAAA